MKISCLLAMTFISSLASVSFGSKGMPICDKYSGSALCATAEFSPAPDPELTEAFHEHVDAAQAAFVAETHDNIDGSLSGGPACNWAETNDRRGYVLDCRYTTISGKVCHLMTYPDFERDPATTNCNGHRSNLGKEDTPGRGTPNGGTRHRRNNLR